MDGHIGLAIGYLIFYVCLKPRYSLVVYKIDLIDFRFDVGFLADSLANLNSVEIFISSVKDFS